MSHLTWLIILVSAKTILGLTALGLVTKYYWGARRTPPLSKELRWLLREKDENRAGESKI